MSKFRIVAEPQNFPDNYPEIEVFMKKNLETLKQNGSSRPYPIPVSQGGEHLEEVAIDATVTEPQLEPSDPAKVTAAIEKYVKYLEGVYEKVKKAEEANDLFINKSEESMRRGGFLDLSREQYDQYLEAYQAASSQLTALVSRVEITLMMLGKTSLSHNEKVRLNYRLSCANLQSALQKIKDQKGSGDTKEAEVKTKYEALNEGDVELFNTPAALCSTSTQSKHYNPESFGCIMM